MIEHIETRQKSMLIVKLNFCSIFFMLLKECPDDHTIISCEVAYMLGEFNGEFNDSLQKSL